MLFYWVIVIFTIHFQWWDFFPFLKNDCVYQCEKLRIDKVYVKIERIGTYVIQNFSEKQTNSSIFYMQSISILKIIAFLVSFTRLQCCNMAGGWNHCSNVRQLNVTPYFITFQCLYLRIFNSHCCLSQYLSLIISHFLWDIVYLLALVINYAYIDRERDRSNFCIK